MRPELTLMPGVRDALYPSLCVHWATQLQHRFGGSRDPVNFLATTVLLDLIKAQQTSLSDRSPIDVAAAVAAYSCYMPHVRAEAFCWAMLLTYAVSQGVYGQDVGPGTEFNRIMGPVWALFWSMMREEFAANGRAPLLDEQEMEDWTKTEMEARGLPYVPRESVDDLTTRHAPDGALLMETKA